MGETIPKCSLHDWASLRSELLFAYDQRIPAGTVDGKGTRGQDFSAWLMRRGSAWVRSDGEEVTARKGEWLICFGKRIEQRFSSDAHVLSLRVLQGWPDGSPLFSGSTVHVLEAVRHPGLERGALPLLRFVKNISWNQSLDDPRNSFLWKTRLDYAAYIQYERQLLAWLVKLAQSLVKEGRTMHVPQNTDPRLARVFHVLDSLPPGRSFPLKDVCRASSLTSGRLNFLCIRAYGFTTRAYWERRRVEQARQALQLPIVRIKELALELGFLQLSHFSAWFKRHVGVSPRQFHKKSRLGGSV